MNRLASETSPYLLQHKDNPVDWYPWGPEAFAKALSEDKPIFLSVGYSSCHWCHVMEHESFVDSGVAALLNEHFVSIKVDREERPDVDEAYMTAVQLSSGRGGWPMSVFLTPDRRPFFAATYLPKQDHPQSPGFLTVLAQIERVWKEERPKVEEIAAQYDEAIRASVTRGAPLTEVTLDQEFLDEVVKTLSLDFDEENGGFGGAPKFPPHTAIEFLLAYSRQYGFPKDLRQTAGEMAFFTLEKMALGGIRDHIGGGFHRYSTDDHWLLPHFEKMLYDNALLMGNYSQAASFFSDASEEQKRRFYLIAREIADWVLREMTTAEGLFCSALDADSEGEEGKYYVWSVGEIDRVLGKRSQAFKEAFQIRAQGNFRDEATGHVTGQNIPHLLENVERYRFDVDLELLRAAREKRVKPGLDYKVLVSWNGLMIGALAESGRVKAADRAAEAILRYEKEYGGLPHQISGRKPSGDGFLEDYAYFIDGLFRLESGMLEYEESARSIVGRGGMAWREEAVRLTQVMIEKFYDEERGGFYSTSTNHEDLFGRTKPVFDQPLPSPNALAIKALVAIEDKERARQSLSAFLGWMARAPAATESLYRVGMDFLDLESRVYREPVVVELSSKTLDSVDGKAPGTVILEIPEGHHLTLTKVEIEPFTFEIFYPPAPNDRYEGRVEIPFRILNGDGEFELKVSFQICTETECLFEEEYWFYGVVQPT